jgi:hypothetical protein
MKETRNAHRLLVENPLGKSHLEEREGDGLFRPGWLRQAGFGISRN